MHSRRIVDVRDVLRSNFAHPVYRYDDLLENEFVEGVMTELVDLQSDIVDRYTFLLYSSNGAVDPPTPMVIENNKQYILIYLSDEAGTVPAHLSRHFVAIFKCYTPSRPGLPQNLFPFPLGYTRNFRPDKHLPARERPTNVFFSGNLHQGRYRMYAQLTFWRHIPKHEYVLGRILNSRLRLRLPRDLSRKFPLSKVWFTDGFRHGLPMSEYSQMLSESKIALCPPGFENVESFRIFEAMKAGCVVISEPLPENHFYAGSPIIQLDDWGQARAKVDKLLSNVAKLEDIQRATLKWWNEVCCEKAVAKYMLNCLQGLPPNN